MKPLLNDYSERTNSWIVCFEPVQTNAADRFQKKNPDIRLKNVTSSKISRICLIFYQLACILVLQGVGCRDLWCLACAAQIQQWARRPRVPWLRHFGEVRTSMPRHVTVVASLSPQHPSTHQALHFQASLNLRYRAQIVGEIQNTGKSKPAIDWRWRTLHKCKPFQNFVLQKHSGWIIAKLRKR